MRYTVVHAQYINNWHFAQCSFEAFELGTRARARATFSLVTLCFNSPNTKSSVHVYCICINV